MALICGYCWNNKDDDYKCPSNWSSCVFAVCKNCGHGRDGHKCRKNSKCESCECTLHVDNDEENSDR